MSAGHYEQTPIKGAPAGVEKAVTVGKVGARRGAGQGWRRPRLLLREHLLPRAPRERPGEGVPHAEHKEAAMMNETAIGWTDLTWNVWSGCKKISAGCAHCYADQLAEQRRGGLAFPHGFELTMRPKNLLDPPRALKKHGPSLIFVESMSDVGIEDRELSAEELSRLEAHGFSGMDHVRAALFDAIEGTPEHRYQILTKRPGRLLAWFMAYGRHVPPSCWIGTTIEDARALPRLDMLRAFRDLGAVVLFVSAEPLLGDLVAAGLRLEGIDWLIAGGESGTHASEEKARGSRFLVERTLWVRHRRDREPVARLVGPWRPNQERARWVARLRDEAERADCAFFFKQWGGPRPDSGGRLLDGRTHDALPEHVPSAMPVGQRERGAATAGLARKLPVVQP